MSHRSSAGVDPVPPLLFTYGTLAPESPEEAARPGWHADAVRGRLYDLGSYPALVDQDDPNAGWVEGHVRAVTMEQLTGCLDPYEGVDTGVFRRVCVRTRAGRQVWLYVYCQPVPPSAIGPIARWSSTKRVHVLPPPDHQEGGV